ncbi:DUF6233 domain-containing protein [Streptomyces sp. NPDC001212]
MSRPSSRHPSLVPTRPRWPHPMDELKARRPCPPRGWRTGPMGSDLTVAPVVHGAWARNGRATWSYGKDRKQGAQPAAPNPPPSKTTRTASGSTGTAATAARPPGPSSSRTYARPLRDLTEPCECCVTTGRRRRLRPGRHREAGLSPQCVVRKVLRERQPSGWGLQKLRGGRGPAGGVLHALDCEEAPQGAPLLDVEHALSRRTRGRGCAICAAARRSSRPLLRGFDHIGDGDS